MGQQNASATAPALHVFHDVDLVHWVVAASVEDAIAWALEEWGPTDKRDDLEQRWDSSLFWVRVGDDELLTIREDERRFFGETKTCGEWARSSGRGFLCGTES